MDSLLERIEENRLDALYLFINETLRDRNEYDRFCTNLFAVLPNNWSIQRVEVGHEFLSFCHHQDELFDMICSLEALRTLIISDGYVPRKDNGSVRTRALLTALPRARNLINLDLQRLHFQTVEEVEMLSDCFEDLSESLEEIRITGLVLSDQVSNFDAPIQQCTEMQNLRSLAISAKQQETNTNNNNNNNNLLLFYKKTLLSESRLLDLCQNSTTLQDLGLRNMHLTDETCQTLATALETNSFLTSLDIRQNEWIGNKGYSSILHALERNYDLWCTVMVDNESFQAKFNSLIELNQANRGDLVRHPTREKLCRFVEKLQDDPTALWYFFAIHDTILYPLVNFCQWKTSRERRLKQQQQQQQLEQEENQNQPKNPLSLTATSATTTKKNNSATTTTPTPTTTSDGQLTKRPRLSLENGS